MFRRLLGAPTVVRSGATAVLSLTVFTIVVVSMVVLSMAVASVAVAAPCWRPPVIGVVTDPFRAPTCPYCAGNRGIEYRVASGVEVSAVAAGTVTFSGSIAGVRYVVVQHANGWRATYGRITTTALRTGDAVLAGGRVGVATGRFYFGLRDGDTYIDPAPMLGRQVGRPRLVPLDGRPPRPAPQPRLRCGV